MRGYEIYKDEYGPLPEGEAKLLVENIYLSTLLLLVVALVISFVFQAVLAGGPAQALASGAWLDFFVAQFLPRGLAWLGVVIAPIALIASFRLVDSACKKLLPSYKEDMLATRQGVTGELCALPDGRLFPGLVLDNICEEFLFRGTAIPIVLAICGGIGSAVGLDGSPALDAVAGTIAVVASAVVFWLAHFQYRNVTSVVITIVLAVVLALIYLVSGSLLVCIAAHVAYNVYVITRERKEAVEDDGYYGGKRPVSFITDMAASKGAGASDGAAKETGGSAGDVEVVDSFGQGPNLKA